MERAPRTTAPLTAVALGAPPIRETPPMTVDLRPRGVSLLLAERDLRTWLARAQPGDLIEYHRGVLTIDRLLGSRLPELDRRELDRVAKVVFDFAAADRGYLLQRRHGDGDYSYIFVHRAPFLSQKGAS